MATGKTYFSRSKFRFLPGREGADNCRSTGYGNAVFELDESDLFNSPRAGGSSEGRRSASKTRISKQISAKVVDAGDRSVTTAAASLPVNIPDWSKILRNEYIENRRDSFDDNDDEDANRSDDSENERFKVPPHEFLAKKRIASFSVHEGIGRTLKGRDLSRVRDAIWQKTGFED